ncbi:hypothetical protein [Tuberibacillus sp. Marseille-P3662]|uniref:hypothetical protein n=1 Tax=Tuberibacillus sp. Marseille-P3662 TaxID=1965358 RepID=UPI000A1C9FA3|nr:hypothetical protein [Tuberibacillus sp. Marseille-P3662]
MGKTRILKWIAGSLEILFAIPFLAYMFLFSTLFTPLVLMLAFHIVILVFSVKEEQQKHPSILGIVASLVGFIPFVGWLMHLLTGIFYMVDAGTSKSKKSQNEISA